MFLLERFQENRDKDAIIWKDRAYSYEWLLAAFSQWSDWLQARHIPPQAIVALEGDFSPNAIALLLAIIARQGIVVPLTSTVESKKLECREVAQAEFIIQLDANDGATFSCTSRQVDNELLLRLRKSGHPGLVLFSSGSAGKSKAALHDFMPLLEKFKARRHSHRCLAFLLFNHIGGLNTIFYTLSNAGCVIALQDRSPDGVCAAIAKHKGELLPTSPTFINLLLLSEAYTRHDLSSLRLVTYGTETMPESTLHRFRELFPNVRMQQTYGLSEVGILRSKSLSSDSLWVKIGGEGFETRIVNGLLEIKGDSLMLGYLNATSPFTEDGWFKTGDSVEVDGEYFRILGRHSDLINVGGEKVYPGEVESFLQTMAGVEDVTVRGEPNAITGQMLVAYVKIKAKEPLEVFRNRLRAFCRGKLPRFKIPQKVVLVEKAIYSERFKKIRQQEPQQSL